MSKMHVLKLLETAGTGKSGRFVQTFLENHEYGINIFQKTWNGVFVIWDPYLKKTLTYFFLTLTLWNFETSKLRNPETNKPINFETKKPTNQTFSFKGIPLPLNPDIY